MKAFLLLTGLGLILGLVISWRVAGSLVAPVNENTPLPAEFAPPVSSFHIPSKSGSEIAGWHVHSGTDKGVIILLHGIRSNKLAMLGRARMLYEHGYSSVLIDFQAHGESPGEHISVGYLEKYDVLAALRYAGKHHPDEPVGIIGISMGGAAAVLASPGNIDALVLESVYPTLRAAVHNRVRAKLGFMAWLPAEILLAQLKPRLGFAVSELSPRQEIDKLEYPVMLISGNRDKHTTTEETRALYARARYPKELWLVAGLGHEDIHAAMPEQYREKVLGFFDEHM